MSKLAILKLGPGDFQQGFAVTLQIQAEQNEVLVEVGGNLPSAPELPQHYAAWRVAYACLGLRTRLEASSNQVTNVSLAALVEDCEQAAILLRQRFNQWLLDNSFRGIREKLLEVFSPSDAVRLVLQTEDIQLQHLPWHSWDWLERYPKIEVAFSSPTYEKVEPLAPHRPIPKVRILAILGSRAGIDIETDRQTLEQLPDTEIHFLVEPRRQELTDQLWAQPWDILFFAGHSFTQTHGESGKIAINSTEHLTISQVRYALKTCVGRGLKMAIFNSCDGLGLAREFADLKIPQMILMREPVPDQVAQIFLKYFLESFAAGQSFYLAVREARQRLESVEDDFPCATWLPVIYQNLAETPPTWHQLKAGSSAALSASPEKSVPQLGQLGGWKGWSTLAIATGVAGVLFGIRLLGLLQPWELTAWDRLLQARPRELPDSKILVVKVTEEDVRTQITEEQQGVSLSDRFLDELLAILEQSQPRTIGLDIFRDYPANGDYPDLATRLRESDRLFTVCRVSNPGADRPDIPPPPERPTNYLGFSNTQFDVDKIARRHLLGMTPNPGQCGASYGLSTQLALHYLQAEDIYLEFTENGAWKLGNLKFNPIESRTGGYQNTDTRGHQILLNYRVSKTPLDAIPSVTLGEVLAGEVGDEFIRDRVVLIGTTAESFKDYVMTPYRGAQGGKLEIPGVVLQAQMVSQLLSAVLDDRKLIRAWPLWLEGIWIWAWALWGVLSAYHIRQGSYWGLALGLSVLALYIVCWGVLMQWGWWAPLLPAAIVLSVSSLIVRALMRSNFLSMKGRLKPDYLED